MWACVSVGVGVCERVCEQAKSVCGCVTVFWLCDEAVSVDILIIYTDAGLR